MSRYRKVDTRIWNDEKFRSMPDDGKFAFLFVLTHPQMTSLGAMRSTVAGLASELGWPAKRMSDAIEHAIEHGMVIANHEASFIGLPNFLKYNEPEGPNSVTKAWIAALDMVPECPEKHLLISLCRKYLDGKSDAFRHAIGHGIWDAFQMPCPIQEQEQEQEQKRSTALSRSPLRGSPKLVDKAKAKGTRLDPSLQLPDEWIAWSKTELVDVNRCHAIFVEFKDYWIAKPGKDGVKLDWFATWRNWIRREKKTSNGARVTDQNAEAIGKSIGLFPKPGESMYEFKARVTKKIADGD